MINDFPKSNSNLIIFIPSFMGSSLYLNTRNTFAGDKTQEIWSSDIIANIQTLSIRPHKLNPTQLSLSILEPREVIAFFEDKNNPEPLKRRNVMYEKLLTVCKSHSHKFIPFKYNWIQDNLSNAEVLANCIENEDKSNVNKICLVTHGMGGIIARLMLLKNPDIATKISLLFEIATPLKGSALAYDCLKGGLRIMPFFKQYESFIQEKQIKQALQRCMERCYSLYQLLPPEEEKILYDAGGQTYSALDLRIWHDDLHKKQLATAKRVHEQLCKPIRVMGKIVSVYSNRHPTVMQYRIQPQEDYDTIGEVGVWGDGNVTCYSSPCGNRGLEAHRQMSLIDTEPCDHTGLCQNRQVLDLLEEELRAI